MKLTKEILEVLKYHGFMTVTGDNETFLKYFDTVEKLAGAGFIVHGGVFDFLRNIFDEDGVNRSVPDTTEELDKQAVEANEDEPIAESKPEVVEETPVPEPEVVEVNEEVLVEEPVVEEPKPKKTTTTKKKTTTKKTTTKKES